MSALFVGVYALFVLLGIWMVWSVWPKTGKARTRSSEDDGVSKVYNDIEPLADFDWRITEPIQLRPFKPTYHLTMALQACELSDLVAVDKTYLDRIKDRRDLIATKRSEVIGYNPVAKDAVDELYTWIFSTYLPKRFPTMFSLVPPEKGPSRYLLNRVTNEHIPLTPPSAPIESLKTLGRHVDNEFLILLPTASATLQTSLRKIIPTQSPQEPYYLHAFTLCYPSGFDTTQKLGLPLAAIHAPVPGYSSKIEKSMDRFFASLPFGKAVKRANWSVQLDDEFFHREGNHISLSPSAKSDKGSSGKGNIMAPAMYSPTRRELAEWEGESGNVEVGECRLRCERQTLHRLEGTGALVFGFKTFLYPLQRIREEGGGEEMAQAVEGLWRGSVSGMAVYKRGVVWGSRVCGFLRGSG